MPHRDGVRSLVARQHRDVHVNIDLPSRGRRRLKKRVPIDVAFRLLKHDDAVQIWWAEQTTGGEDTVDLPVIEREDRLVANDVEALEHVPVPIVGRVPDKVVQILVKRHSEAVLPGQPDA